MALPPEIRQISHQLNFLESTVLGILLYGSYAQNSQSTHSDIDICLVAPQIKNHSKIFLEILGRITNPLVEIRFFELMPLNLKASVIENHIIIFSPNSAHLYEYFYKYRKLWNDQRQRQNISGDELLKMINNKIQET